MKIGDPAVSEQYCLNGNMFVVTYFYKMSQNQSGSHCAKIENCLLQNIITKALRAAQLIIDPKVCENIGNKIDEIHNSDTMVECIENFLFTLINTIENLKQMIHVNVQREDYENLQNAVQKSQGEIRKHIRLEQQLKIYMEGLEDKIESLEKQLKLQSEKYHQLFENTKIIDFQKRELKRKLREYESKFKTNQEKEQKHLSHKASKLITEPSIYDSQGNGYRMYNQRVRNKAKHIPDKLLQNSRTDQSKKKRLETEILVSLPMSPSKSRLYDKQDIKQMTQTIHLKQRIKKQSRKLLKYSTDHRMVVHASSKKQIRSNSVCN